MTDGVGCFGGKNWCFLFLLVLFGIGAAATADVRLPAIIGDNMVLQRGKQVPIWGWADPNEEVMVSVSWQALKWGVRADTDGKWSFKMKPTEVGGPHEITLTGNNTITISNILVGEVWVCSGQSNMEWPLRLAANAEKEIAGADYPDIRLFTVAKKVADKPQADCTGNWTACSPDSAPGFSAVGYFFGKELHKELDVPIGLIHTSWGGTPAEAWTSAPFLMKLEDYQIRLKQIEEVLKDPASAEAKYQERMEQWLEQLSSAGKAGKSRIEPDFDDSDWKQMELPKLWNEPELANFDGLVWFRKEIDLPESWAGKDLTLELGPIDDMDTTWFNGTKVGGYERSGHHTTNRRYTVPADAVKAGGNVIIVKVLDTGGGGGIYGKPDQLSLKAVGSSDAPIKLAGTWKYEKGFDMASVPPQPRPPAQIDNPHAPTSLYNGMIAPLLPYSIAGAIWYQGESNAGRAYQYRTLFPTMIECWRNDWLAGDFPFLFVQLANFMAVNDEPVESAWAELREAQSMTLDLPATGMAVIIDIGEADNIHPKNKQDVGKRLSLWALAKTYGKDIVYSGPLYKSMKVDGNRAIIEFDHVGGGLVAKDGQLRGFAVAGEDRKFVWADATIEGDTVLVSSAEVEKPVSVRYAWANNPVCNLYNAEGLPASPFRTDDWPGETIGNR